MFRPPGYPSYLALFGKDKVFRGDHTAPLIGQALLFGIGAYLLMLTVRRWWGEGVALLGGLLYAVDPWSKHYVALVLSETLAGTVALAAALRVHACVGATELAAMARRGRAGCRALARARGLRVRTGAPRARGARAQREHARTADCAPPRRPLRLRC